MKYSKKQIEETLKKIYAGEITEYNLPEGLYLAIADYLKTGVYKGFGTNFTKLTKQLAAKVSTTFDTSDLELLSELRENVYMFSAAKTFQQVKDMTEKLVDENGTIRSYQDFRTDADTVFNTYNNDWLKSEHTTAIAQAQSAVKWNSIEKQKDILPFLTYSTIGDACNICAPLNRMTAKVGDPIWDNLLPPNHFNCECLVTQSEDADVSENKNELSHNADRLMSPVFKMNSGKDAVVFNPDHPYFSVPKADKEFAQNNFNLPIPKHD